MSGPWEDYADQSGPWNDYAKAPDNRAQAKTWSDVPAAALKNAPASAYEYGKNIVDAVSHPIDTAGNIADVLAGGLRAGAKAVLPESVFNAMDQNVPVPLPVELTKENAETKANAVGQMLANRYGGTENIKNTLATDPVGAAGDLATVLTGAGGLVAKAPGMVGRAGQMVAAAGNMIDPLQATARGVGAIGNKVIAPIASHALSATTGVGEDAIKTAVNAGKTGNKSFLDNMRGAVEPNQVVQMARDALDQMRQERGAAYRSGMIDIKNDKAILDFAPVEDAMNKAAGMATFKGQINPEAASTLKSLNELIDNWKKLDPAEYHTPEGMDFLKKSVGDVLQAQSANTVGSKMAGAVYNAVKDAITQQAPTYSKVMEGYSKASEKIDDILKTFSLKDGTSTDTTLRKLQSVFRNNVNTNYGQRTRLMDEMATKAPDLPYALAGQQMNSFLPRGLGRVTAGLEAGGALALLNPKLAAMLAASSPRLVGEGAYLAGRGMSVANQGLQMVPPAASLLAQQGGRINGLLGQ